MPSGDEVRKRSVLGNAGASIMAQAAPPKKADPLDGQALQDPLSGGLPEHLQRPVTPQTAASADAFAGATFQGFENFKQWATPEFLGGPKKESRLRGQQLSPLVADFRSGLKQEVPGYGTAVAASDRLNNVSDGLTAASVGASLTGFGAAAAPALGIASSGAKLGSGFAELEAASSLDQRPASPTGRGVAQQGLHEVSGGKKVVKGAAGLTGLPGASAVAGLAFDKLGGDDARQANQVALVEGARQAEVIAHGRRKGQVQGQPPSAAPPAVEGPASGSAPAAGRRAKRAD